MDILIPTFPSLSLIHYIIDISEYTTKTNEASSNVITVNKTFIMKEMDSLIALEVLRRSHCNISHISGDRLQKLPFIIKILENEPEKYLDDLLKGLQEEKAMKGLCLRLQNSRKIFSVNIGKNHSFFPFNNS